MWNFRPNSCKSKKTPSLRVDVPTPRKKKREEGTRFFLSGGGYVYTQAKKRLVGLLNNLFW